MTDQFSGIDNANFNNFTDGYGIGDDSIPINMSFIMGTASEKIPTIIDTLNSHPIDNGSLLIEGVAVLPVNPASRKQAMAEHLSRVNENLPFGRFDFNFDDAGFGSVKYLFSKETSQDYNDSAKKEVLMTLSSVIGVFGDDIWNVCRAA